MITYTKTINKGDANEVIVLFDDDKIVIVDETGTRITIERHHFNEIREAYSDYRQMELLAHE